MFHLRAATASAIILALTLAACGGDKKNADDASSFDGDQPADDNLMEQADSLGEEGGDDSGDDGSGEVSSDGPTIEKRKKKKKAREQDYLLMYRDCKALAGTYGRAYENDELKKLEKQRFNEKQLANAQNNVKKAAREAADNWFSACESIVDSPFLYTRLSCAMKASTIQRFNDCWDGKVDNAE
jgi:hypothetical protein